MDREGYDESKQDVCYKNNFLKGLHPQIQLIFCSTDMTKRVWWNITFPQTVTPRQELCIAQLNNRRAKSLWHSFERASKRSSESGGAESTRANNPLCPLTPQLSRSTSPPGTRGTRATAGSKVRTTTGLSRVTCQSWNPSAHAGQFPTPFPSPPPLPYLPWVGTDVWRSHSGAIIGPTGLNKGWHTRSESSWP